jgi:RNA polymerase sigma-70 factor, ECF subfamily
MTPPVADADVKGATSEASRERRQEFEDILPHALPLLRRMAMRQLRNPEDAEDAVQDAMLLAFRHIAQFDGRARMTTWLTTIVINVARRQLQRRRRCRLLSLDQATEKGKVTISEMLADPTPTQDRILERRELRELVAKLTTTLSPGQQKALLLSQRDGFTGKQVAQTLGVPEGTVKARLARSRIQLTQRFHAITATPKTRASNAGSKAMRNASSAGYKVGCAQNTAPLPVGVLRQQGGCEGWIGA